MKLVFKKECR